MTGLWPNLLNLSCVVRPDTILRWHRAGFRAYWRWKSRGQPGRPKIGRELRELIRQMSWENRLWGAPRIHGELLKLGFEIAESTVSKYMVRHRGPPSQTWRTFLRNHADSIAAIDLCVVQTVTFDRLFAFIVVGHGRAAIEGRLPRGIGAELGGTPAPAAQPHATIEGVWAPDASTCSIRNFREGLLATIINMDGAWAGDTFCIFQNRQQIETGWRVVAHCSKPGEQWTTHVRLTIKDDRLIWTSKRGTQAYTRCAPDFLMAGAR